MPKNQPKIATPKTRLQWLLDITGVVIFVSALLYLLTQYAALPDMVPGHYNEEGEVDRWGGKEEMWILPIVGASLWTLMTVLEKYPHIYNYFNFTLENAAAQYKNGRLMVNVLKNECLVIFSFLIYQNIQVAKGAADGLPPAFLPVLLVITFGTTILFFVRMLRL